jgi:hypothetical protein
MYAMKYACSVKGKSTCQNCPSLDVYCIHNKIFSYIDVVALSILVYKNNIKPFKGR